MIMPEGQIFGGGQGDARGEQTFDGRIIGQVEKEDGPLQRVAGLEAAAEDGGFVIGNTNGGKNDGKLLATFDLSLGGNLRRARLVDGLAAVSIVGAGINAAYGNVRAGTDALAQIRATPAAVATSSFRITWMIPRERVDDAVRALHARFLDAPSPLLP